MKRSLLLRKTAVACAVLMLACNSLAGRFLTGQRYLLSDVPGAIACGDLDGDGHLDIVVAEPGRDDNGTAIAVLYGKGDGTFTAAIKYTVPYDPQSIAVADFNNDGKADIALVCYHNLTILLSNGDRTFQTALNRPLDAQKVVSGDFNADGKADLIAFDGKTLRVLLGKGNGTFKDNLDYEGGLYPMSNIVVGDFNNDGKMDFVGEDSNTLCVFMGNGDGTFQPATYAITSSDLALAMADFNQDGKLDIVDYGGIRLGNGDGTFQDPIPLPSVLYFASLTAGDFNGDGKPDVVVSRYDSDLVLFAGNGDGTLQTSTFDFSVGKEPQWIVMADFNADGIPDVAVTDPADVAVEVALGNNAATFLTGRAYPNVNYGVIGADLNGDGKAELIGYSAGLGVAVNNGDGTFQPTAQYPISCGTTQITSSDVNNDGKPDVLAVGPGGLCVLLGNGDGTLQTYGSYAFSQYAQSIAVGDFNNDGYLDVAVVTEDALTHVLLNNGDGSFRIAGSYTGSGFYIAAADFDNDGNLDIAVGGGYAYSGILWGNGDGTFTRQGSGGGVSVLVGDVNGDGKPDLIWTNNSDVEVWLGTGSRKFNYPPPISGNYFVYGVADFNGDGYDDFVAGSGFSLSYFISKGDGTFFPPVLTVAGSFMSGLAVADFNGDRAPDLVATDMNEPDAVILLNTGGVVVQLYSSPNPSKLGQPVTFRVNVLAAVPGQQTPTGSLTFSDNGKVVGKANLNNGTASVKTSRLSVGTHNIQATYSGSKTFNGKASRVLQQVVNP